MAIQREIWERAIVENLFAENSFLSKAYNADEYVNQGKIVHIPQASAPSAVVKNRSQKPATAKQRTDSDLTFEMAEFTTDPIYIPHADTVELSYDKRESVLRNDKLQLADVVAKDFLYNWSPSKSHTVSTSGAEVAAHVHEKATGSRLAVTRKDVFALMTRFNRDNIPQEDRYLLLDAEMYSQLLQELSSQEAMAFHAQADLKNGVMGKLLSFNVMQRSTAALYTGDGSKKSWDTTGAATDVAAALAWQKECVVRALGEVRAFENEGDPTWYGDIYSFLVRAGGRIRRSDEKGVVALIQGTKATE